MQVWDNVQAAFNAWLKALADDNYKRGFAAAFTNSHLAADHDFMPLATDRLRDKCALSDGDNTDACGYTAANHIAAVQRFCDGCGRMLRRANHTELLLAFGGQPIPSVRGECGCKYTPSQAADRVDA